MGAPVSGVSTRAGHPRRSSSSERIAPVRLAPLDRLRPPVRRREGDPQCQDQTAGALPTLVPSVLEEAVSGWFEEDAAVVGKSIRQSPGSRDEGHIMGLWDWWKSLLLQGSPSVPPARRLDGRSKTLLAASIKTLPYETPGWITNKEAKQLFSSMDDDYAFGEMDEAGKGNIADFAAHVAAQRSRPPSAAAPLR
jgi:hypothetical protein